MSKFKKIGLVLATILALGFSGCGSSSSNDSSATTPTTTPTDDNTTTTTELYITSAVYNNKLTTTLDDDILTITFNKNIKESSLKSDISLNYEINGTGAIGSDSKGEYNSTTFTHTISLSSSSTAFSVGDTIKIAKNSITDIDGLYPKEFNGAKIIWSSIPKTGQTTSYTDFDDGYYQKGVARSYKRDKGIVTDNVTGLMWQDDYSDNNGTIKKANWDGAQTYCSNLSLGGFNDWRLPTIKELLTIVDIGRSYPSIDPIFTNITSSYYWSSSTDVSYTSNAWDVYFSGGGTDIDYKSNSYYVRCVSGSTTTNENTFIRDDDKKIVTDSKTKLMWQDEAYTEEEKTAYNNDTNQGKVGDWQYAITYCKNLTLGGYSDWRLPNRNELLSIVDFSKANPAIKENIFKNITSSDYWSSSTYVSNTSTAWNVDFSSDSTGRNAKSVSNYVRCTRDRQ